MFCNTSHYGFGFNTIVPSPATIINAINPLENQPVRRIPLKR